MFSVLVCIMNSQKCLELNARPSNPNLSVNIYHSIQVHPIPPSPELRILALPLSTSNFTMPAQALSVTRLSKMHQQSSPCIKFYHARSSIKGHSLEQNALAELSVLCFKVAPVRVQHGICSWASCRHICSYIQHKLELFFVFLCTKTQINDHIIHMNSNF